METQRLPHLSSSVTSSSEYSLRTDPGPLHIDLDIFHSPALRRPTSSSSKKQDLSFDIPSSSPPSSPVMPPPSPSPHSPGARDLKQLSPRHRTLEAQMRMRRNLKFEPYKVPGAPPLELRFAMRSLGRSSHCDVRFEDAIMGQEKFKRGLTYMSDATFIKAYTARLAFKKCILSRISLTQTEIDALEKQRDFIQSLDDEAHGELAVIDNQLSSFKELMDERGMVDDISYHHAVYKDDLLALATADVGLRQMTSNRALSIRESIPVSSDTEPSDVGDLSSSEGDASLLSAEDGEDK